MGPGLAAALPTLGQLVQICSVLHCPGRLGHVPLRGRQETSPQPRMRPHRQLVAGQACRRRAETCGLWPLWWVALSVNQLRGREPATPAQRLRLQVKLLGLRLVPSQLLTIGRRCCHHGLCSTDPSAPFACDLPGHPPERGDWLSEPHFTWLSRSLCRPHSCSVINSAELF